MEGEKWREGGGRGRRGRKGWVWGLGGEREGHELERRGVRAPVKPEPGPGFGSQHPNSPLRPSQVLCAPVAKWVSFISTAP